METQEIERVLRANEVAPRADAGSAAAAEGKLWRPRRVLITPEAYALEHGRVMLARAEKSAPGDGAADQSPVWQAGRAAAAGRPGQEIDERRAYALAKTTLAIVVSPPGQSKLQPIPPSADWQFHVAQGCPAHCQYCYLAGSLSGPPVTRVYANLQEILEGLPGYAGKGTVTSRSRARADEGTTFEASCYTDPLGIEHLTGALEAAIEFFGSWEAPVQLPFTTKFDGVARLLSLEHRGRTRVRFSLNAASVSRDFEGGTASVLQRLRALRAMALAGYPVGLTIAPIMPVEGWREEYMALFTAVAEALSGVDTVDLTAELITHRFTPGSKEVLLGWYPRTTLDLREESRAEKRTKFGGFKYVYPKDSMGEMKAWFYEAIGAVLPAAKILYWT